MRHYVTRSVNAPWLTCQVCEKLADIALRVEVSGGHGRKGSRALGYYCQAHGEEKLAALRAKQKRTSPPRRRTEGW